ncbi:uncharacterized protein LOC133185904 [Saccostrea echinata]|uniref:uncharacterized protein LOC133185904 n=1 Tax=Saccostrea echinata TaxID=191078 RepID=UPI002A82137D|nr:uncharacterized protein LOC133185904 [Saccostrea echinata]
MQESDVDRYIRESSKSYKNCRIKNSARRNSLQKKTMGIESEKRLAQSELSREEKQLREHLKHMQIDKMKNYLVKKMRDNSVEQEEDSSDDHNDVTEPYDPNTYRLTPLLYSPSQNRRNPSHEEQGRLYAQRRSRRVSKEFEDLNMDTKTGSLKQPFNVAKRVLSSHTRVKSSSLSKISSPRLQRSSTSLSSPRTRKTSSDHSDGSSSTSAISSLEDLHWIGDPEATKSVRRNRKTSEEQHLEFELKRLAKEKRPVMKKNSK